MISVLAKSVGVIVTATGILAIAVVMCVIAELLSLKETFLQHL